MHTFLDVWKKVRITVSRMENKKKLPKVILRAPKLVKFIKNVHLYLVVPITENIINKKGKVSKQGTEFEHQQQKNSNDLDESA